MTSRAANTVALLVVPPGTHRPEPLAVALRELHPDWVILPVWAGDPHLRPVLEAPLGRWFDEPGEGGATRERQLVARSEEDALWLRAVSATSAALASGAERVLLLIVGAVAVLGDLDALMAPLEDGSDTVAVFVPRAVGALDDDRWPGERDLLLDGSFSRSVAGFSSRSHELLEWLTGRLDGEPLDNGAGVLGRAMDRAAVAFPVSVCRDPAIGAGAVRWTTAAPALLDLPRFDADEPWTLDRGRRHDGSAGGGGRGRVEVAASPEDLALLARAAPQLAGRVEPVCLPGGIAVDDVVRRAVCRAMADRRTVVPSPWSEATAFRRWLEGRYWQELHEGRRDLVAAFPDPFGRDADAYRTWARRAAVDDGRPMIVGVPEHAAQRWDQRPLAPGVDLVGYLHHESSLGDVARRLLQGLVEAGVPSAPLAYARSASPLLTNSIPTGGVVSHTNTLAVVTADQFGFLRGDHPELFAAGTHLIGYWFWELEHVPRPMRDAARMVDEIWVGSQFVADAFRAAVDTPVRHVPIPIGEPVASARTRASFERLAALGDRFVFAVVFDHFSVTERKNPVGVIEAFRRAFAPGEGPVLVVKSMNADRRWPQHQHVVWAAGDRPDIVIWDEHLDRADHMAFIRSVDALVSLHRSEGLGLHLAEAMWLGTPVIASRYSGNLDFMDDECSLLIDVELVPVVRGEGVYPPEARWADPDLDQAAAAMRRLVEDAALAERLSTVARRRMEQQPSLAETGRTIAALLGLPALPLTGGDGMAS